MTPKPSIKENSTSQPLSRIPHDTLAKKLAAARAKRVPPANFLNEFTSAKPPRGFLKRLFPLATRGSAHQCTVLGSDNGFSNNFR